MTAAKSKPLIFQDIMLEVRALLSFALPMIVIGLMETAIGFVNIMLLARLGETQLAAFSIASGFYILMLTIILGLFSAISPLIADHANRGNEQEVGQTLLAGIIIGIGISFTLTVFTFFISSHLPQTTANAQVAETIRVYLQAMSFSIMPNVLMYIILQFILGLSKPRLTLYISCVTTPLNIFLNYALMYGKYGFPNLGAAGLGWGTTITYILALISVCWILIKNLNHYQYFMPSKLPNKQHFLAIINLGLPIGIMGISEIAFFALLPLVFNRISIHSVALYQIIIQYLSLVTSATFRIADAIAIRIASAIHKQKYKIKNMMYAGYLVIGVFMFVVCYFFIRHTSLLLSIDLSSTEHAKLLPLAITLFRIAAVFQVVDGFRILFFGALKGIKITSTSMLNSIFSFWIIAFPLITLELLYGSPTSVQIWWFMVLGVTCGLILLIKYFHKALCGMRVTSPAS